MDYRQPHENDSIHFGQTSELDVVEVPGDRRNLECAQTRSATNFQPQEVKRSQAATRC